MFTADKRLMPVDYKPDLDDIDQFDSKKMTSHFATCKMSKDFRKKRAKNGST